MSLKASRRVTYSQPIGLSYAVPIGVASCGRMAITLARPVIMSLPTSSSVTSETKIVIVRDSNPPIDTQSTPCKSPTACGGVVYYPNATLITVVLDNLNTHTPAALY